jgi:hypothetical protein
MPLIKISTYPGRTREQKVLFAKAKTNAAMKILKAKLHHLIIHLIKDPLKIGIFQEKVHVNELVLKFQGCACSIRRFENDIWHETSNRDSATLHWRP